jgi:hypothetical protein
MFTGNDDYGHYNIIEYINIGIKSVLTKLKYKKYSLKRKIDEKIQEDNQSLKKLKKTNYVFEIDEENLSFFGEMDVICKYCSAIYWRNEKRRNCCQQGKIILPKLSIYDDNLKNVLLNDDTFRQLIRYYNNLFCFATFNANVKFQKTKAIYNLTIQGQVCHTIPTTVIPENNKDPKCGQLYIYDNDTSIEKRLQNNEKLCKNHLEILTNILTNNPYAKKYKYLHQLSNIQNLPH